MAMRLVRGHPSPGLLRQPGCAMVGLPSVRAHPRRAGVLAPLNRRRVTTCGLSTAELVGWGLFFSPTIAGVLYAYIKGKGNMADGFSRLVTLLSQGYLQPDVGGKNIPTAEGELSDLAGDEPLFKALYKW